MSQENELTQTPDELTQTPNDSTSPLEEIRKADPLTVARHLTNEHPQLIAMVIAILKNKDKAAAVLKEFPKDIQQDVAYRISTMGKVSSPVVAETLKALATEIQKEDKGISP